MFSFIIIAAAQLHIQPCPRPLTAEESDSPEYQALMHCTPMIAEALAQEMSRPIKISDQLFEKSLISSDFHKQLLSSSDSPCDKVVNVMATCVKANPAHLYTLIAILKEQGDWTKSIISTLIGTLSQ